MANRLFLCTVNLDHTGMVDTDSFVQLLALHLEIINSYVLPDEPMLTLTNWYTSGERISSQTWHTATYWIMIDNLTVRIDTASSWARIYAFLIHAGLIHGAFRWDYTFRPASRRTSYITRNAWTYSLSVNFSALTVGTARRWITWVRRNNFWNNFVI